MTFNAETERIREVYQRRKSLPVDRYSPTKKVNIYFHYDLLRNLLPMLEAQGMYPLRGKKILDLGCGAGGWLCNFLLWGCLPSDICGIDLNEERIAEARLRLPTTEIKLGDASNLPWEDGQFDVVFQFTVFTSILDENMRQAVANEMMRVCKPNGLIVWYDFRYSNPANPDVRGIRRSEIDCLFSPCEIKYRLATLAPPIARRIVPISSMAAEMLSWLPPLKTHYLAFVRKCEG